MQGIRPERLTTEELLRHVYMRLDKPLPREWVVELYARLHMKTHGVRPENADSLTINVHA